MRKLCFLFLCLILFNNILYAQIQCIAVQYKELFDTNSLVEIKGLLYATDTKSIYEEDLNNRKSIKSTKEFSDNLDIKVYTPLINDNEFYITDYTKKNVEFFDYLFADNKSKIVDNFRMNWKLINEKKLINNIECYKAECFFRGRKWEAWYAPSIPYPAGPLKFNGLPGLIMQINDETKRYNFVVEKIEYLKEEVFLNKLNEVQNIKYKQVQSLKEFINERKEIIEAAFNNADKERGTHIIREKMPRTGIELIYEWEEEVKK